MSITQANANSVVALTEVMDAHTAMLDAIDVMHKSLYEDDDTREDRIIHTANGVVEAKAYWKVLVTKHEADRQKAMELNPFRDLPKDEGEESEVNAMTTRTENDHA